MCATGITVNVPAKGAARDAYRIVHGSTGAVYFSPDHYSNFYKIS